MYYFWSELLSNTNKSCSMRDCGSFDSSVTDLTNSFLCFTMKERAFCFKSWYPKQSAIDNNSIQFFKFIFSETTSLKTQTHLKNIRHLKKLIPFFLKWFWFDFDLIWFDLIWFDLNWIDLIWIELIWFWFSYLTTYSQYWRKDLCFSSGIAAVDKHKYSADIKMSKQSIGLSNCFHSQV